MGRTVRTGTIDHVRFPQQVDCGRRSLSERRHEANRNQHSRNLASPPHHQARGLETGKCTYPRFLYVSDHTSLQGIAMVVLDEKNRKMAQDSEMRTVCVCGCLITSNVGHGTETDTSLRRMNLHRLTHPDPRCQTTHRVHLQMRVPNSRHSSPRPPFRGSSPAITYP